MTTAETDTALKSEAQADTTVKSSEVDTSSEKQPPSSNPDVEASGPGSPEDAPVYPGDSLSTPRHILLVGTLCTAMFTCQVGFASAVATNGVIGGSWGITNPGELSWFVSGYSLTVGTFLLVGGRLGDEFGSKRIFVLGMVWFSVWALVAGCSVYTTHVLFIFARVLQGIGPALALPNALAIMGQSYSPGPRKNMSFAWFAGVAPFGGNAGFIFGGLFALAWWPWIFWSQAIAMAGVATFAAWAIPSLPAEEKQKQPLSEKLEALDIPGGLTGVTALVLINFAWNQAVAEGWEQPYVYTCLILGFLFMTAFFLIELKWAKNPILPLAAFNVDIGFVFACTGTGWATFGIWIFYSGRVAMNIGGNTPLQMAAWFCPVIPVGLVSALAVGKLLGRISAAWIMVIGQVAFLIGSTLAASRPVDSIYWTYFFFSVLIITVGMDTSLPAAAILFSDAVEQKYQGIGASIVLTIVNYSISLGLGFAGTIETNINNGGLTDDDLLEGYRGGMWFSVGLSGLGLLLSLVFILKSWRQK